MAIKTKIKCPYCDKEMGKQGIYGHLAGNHPDKEAEYRANNPPKRSNIKPESQEKPKEKEYDYSEEEKGSENYIEPPETPAPDPKPEPKPEPEKKEDPKPVPEIKPAEGDKKADKPKSFLSRILDYNIEF